jgi:hypothetical protein
MRGGCQSAGTLANVASCISSELAVVPALGFSTRECGSFSRCADLSIPMTSDLHQPETSMLGSRLGALKAMIYFELPHGDDGLEIVEARHACVYCPREPMNYISQTIIRGGEAVSKIFSSRAEFSATWNALAVGLQSWHGWQ